MRNERIQAANITSIFIPALTVMGIRPQPLPVSTCRLGSENTRENVAVVSLTAHVDVSLISEVSNIGNY